MVIPMTKVNPAALASMTGISVCALGTSCVKMDFALALRLPMVTASVSGTTPKYCAASATVVSSTTTSAVATTTNTTTTTAGAPAPTASANALTANQLPTWATPVGAGVAALVGLGLAFAATGGEEVKLGLLPSESRTYPASVPVTVGCSLTVSTTM